MCGVYVVCGEAVCVHVGVCYVWVCVDVYVCLCTRSVYCEGFFV